MPKFRLPAQVDLKTRDSSTSKDSIISNGFIEQAKSGSLFTVKRPGVISVALGAGAAHGSFMYNGTLYYWDASVGNTSPNILRTVQGAFVSYVPSQSYGIGAVVTYLQDDTLPYNQTTNPVIPYKAQSATTGSTPRVYDTPTKQIAAPLGTIPWQPVFNQFVGSGQAACLSAMLAYNSSSVAAYWYAVGDPLNNYYLSCSNFGGNTAPAVGNYGLVGNSYFLTQSFRHPDGGGTCSDSEYTTIWNF